MVKSCLKKLIKKSKKYSSIVLVGIGGVAKELSQYLCFSDVEISYAFDNANKFINRTFQDVIITKPFKIEKDKVLYVVTPENMGVRNELIKQLISLNIDNNDIFVYYNVRNADYIKTLTEEEYLDEVKDVFFECFGYDLDVINPKTFNEKISLSKFLDKNPIKAELADKLKAKKWVKEKLGPEYVAKLYGSWKNAEDIDFSTLPNSFVLKTNNSSCSNIVVKDKSKINEKEVRDKLNNWLKEEYGYNFLELHYNQIEPMILCEEYLEGIADSLYDYNVYCFRGEAKYIWCIKESHKPNCKAAFYDKEWKKLPCYYGYPMDEEDAPKPEQLEEMLRLTEVLCSQFNQVRVDWYITFDGRIVFGEMTFTTWAGQMPFEPYEYDELFGALI